jgi:hypothetical protein
VSRWRDWRHWWSSLDRDAKIAVRAWLADHPPPPRWIEGKIAYAFTEMPSYQLPRSNR